MNKQKDIPCSWIGRFNIKKLQFFLKNHCNSNKNTNKLFQTDKLILKFTWKNKHARTIRKQPEKH